jgi:hypothetical protein
MLEQSIDVKLSLINDVLSCKEHHICVPQHVECRFHVLVEVIDNCILLQNINLFTLILDQDFFRVF